MTSWPGVCCRQSVGGCQHPNFLWFRIGVITVPFIQAKCLEQGLACHQWESPVTYLVDSQPQRARVVSAWCSSESLATRIGHNLYLVLHKYLKWNSWLSKRRPVASGKDKEFGPLSTCCEALGKPTVHWTSIFSFVSMGIVWAIFISAKFAENLREWGLHSKELDDRPTGQLIPAAWPCWALHRLLCTSGHSLLTENCHHSNLLSLPLSPCFYVLPGRETFLWRTSHTPTPTSCSPPGLVGWNFMPMW